MKGVEMDDLLEFDAALSEAIRWLEKAQSDLDVEEDDSEAQTACIRFSDAYKAINAIREPLVHRIESTRRNKQEESVRYG